MRLARDLRGGWTRIGLRRTPEGREILAVLTGPATGSDAFAAQLAEDRAIRRALDIALRNSVLAPKRLEQRVADLQAAGQPLTASVLLDRAITLRPANPALVEMKFARLRLVEDSAGALAFARALAADSRRPGEVLLKAITMLHRSGVGLDDPGLVTALANYRRVSRGVRPPGLAEARLYRALGLTGVARRILLDLAACARRRAERATVELELTRLALRQDRWIRDQNVVERAPPARTRRDRALIDARARLIESTRIEIVNPHFGRWEPDGAETLLAPVPELAFDHLIRRVLPGGIGYSAENRLLLVGNSLGGGGMERIMAETYRHFRSAGTFDDVDLALIDWAEEGPRAFHRALAGADAQHIVQLRTGGEAAYPFTLLPAGWRSLVQRLHDHVAETRPRVIHAWNDMTGLFAGFAGLLAGCPRIIVHFHHLPAVPQSGRTRDIASYPACYRMLLARPEFQPLFCSRAAADGYARWWSVEPGGRFGTLHNGITPVKADPARGRALRASLGIPGEAPVIGAVFRFDPVKQPMLWAEAAIAIAARLPDTHFLLVGDGPLREATRARFAEAGHSDRAHMPGQVANVPDHLAAMDLFWLTSRTEGLPTVLIEAQMAGVPVIAFDVGGVGETFADGETGVLVRPGDADAMVSATVRALGDRAWRATASATAVTHAREKFSQKSFFTALAECYRID